MTRGEELTYSALKKEHARVNKAHLKAKAEYDERSNISDEVISCAEEFNRIVNSNNPLDEKIKDLDKLKKRRARVDKILAKDIIKLSDKEMNLSFERDDLVLEIQKIERRQEIRSSAC